VPFQTPTIDLAVLTRDARPLSPEVAASIRAVQGVNLRVNRVIGTPRKSDPHRVATIARARNTAVQQARAPWLMFLDDDVVLAPDCIARLHHTLASRPDFAGVAADYLGESRWDQSSPHVAMGATMFRRSALEQNKFRWEPNKCECLCCCEDLRNMGAKVEYLPTAKAKHLPDTAPLCVNSRKIESTVPCSAVNTYTSHPKVLVAFDRRDVNRFRNAFLRTMRASGNHQEVIVVGYGLYPSEIQSLSSAPGVRVIPKAVNGQMPPVRRLSDFAEVLTDMPEDTPVAYWDASDVIFQGSLDPLWKLAQEHPDKLLAVREPRGYPHNRAIAGWTYSIRHPEMRRRAFQLFAKGPFLNSGFGAGTAATMKAYFAEATRLRHSAELFGTSDWGDQTAMNLYCHSDSNRWHEVAQGWNYCVHDRPVDDVHVSPDGKVFDRRGTPIHAVHGNARSLAKLAIIR